MQQRFGGFSTWADRLRGKYACRLPSRGFSLAFFGGLTLGLDISSSLVGAFAGPGVLAWAFIDRHSDFGSGCGIYVLLDMFVRLRPFVPRVIFFLASLPGAFWGAPRGAGSTWRETIRYHPTAGFDWLRIHPPVYLPPFRSTGHGW